MSDSPLVTPPPSPASPSSAAPGSSTGTPSGSHAPTPPVVPTPPPADYRFGDDAPAWARGRTAQEVLGVAQQMYSTLEGQVRRDPAPPAPAHPAPQGYQPPDPDAYVSGRDLQGYASHAINTQIAPDLQGVINNNAAFALDMVRREYPKEFAKYGPEILGNIAQIPDKRAHTLDNLRKVVKFTLVDHVDEIAAERVSQRIAEMEPTIRSGGAAPGLISQPTTEYTLQSDKLPSDWKARAEKVGLTEAAVNEFCHANSMTREEFFAQFEKTAIPEVTRRG